MERGTHHPLIEQYNVDLILKDIIAAISVSILSSIIAEHQLIHNNRQKIRRELFALTITTRFTSTQEYMDFKKKDCWI
jgi:hypothetical protein